MKALRWIFMLFVFLIVLFVLSMGALRLWLNPQTLQTMLVEQTRERTGYELQMAEPLNVSYLPPQLHFSNLQIRDPHHPSVQMNLKQVALSLDLWALMQDRNQIQGRLFIEQMKLNHWQFDRVRFFPKWVQGVLEIRPIQAELYDGHLQGVVHARHLSSNMPEWDAALQLAEMNVAKWQGQIAPSKKFGLEGLADVETQLRTRGKSNAQMLPNLNGSVHVSVQKGLLVGVDIHYWLNLADRILSHQSALPGVAQARGTSFSNLSGDIDIHSGIAYTKNLQMNADSFFITAQGELDLMKQTIDMHLWVKPRNSAHLDFMVPIIVSGELKQPSVSLDILEIDKWIAKKQIEKVKDRVKSEIDKLPEKTGNFIKQLLGH